MEELMAPHLSSMTRRGGGLQGWEWRVNQEALVLEVGFWIDSQDAMGANLVNTLAEAAAPVLEQQLGREKIMAILSNTGTKRLAKAQFSLPFSRLKMADKDPAARARKL
jgi:hydroxymethylglutaryl-CoA reductase